MRFDEIFHPVQGYMHFTQVFKPEFSKPPHLENALHAAHPETGDSEKVCARRLIHIDWEEGAVPHCPGKLGIHGEVECSRFGSQFFFGKTIEAEQPVGLIETVLTNERRTIQWKFRIAVRNRAKRALIHPL